MPTMRTSSPALSSAAKLARASVAPDAATTTLPGSGLTAARDEGGEGDMIVRLVRAQCVRDEVDARPLHAERECRALQFDELGRANILGPRRVALRHLGELAGEERRDGSVGPRVEVDVLHRVLAGRPRRPCRTLRPRRPRPTVRSVATISPVATINPIATIDTVATVLAVPTGRARPDLDLGEPGLEQSDALRALLLTDHRDHGRGHASGRDESQHDHERDKASGHGVHPSLGVAADPRETVLPRGISIVRIRRTVVGGRRVSRLAA